MSNAILNRQLNNPSDEYYTLYEDIAKGVERFRSHFAGKKVFCNCVNPNKSNFWKYFHEHFSELKLQSLTSCHLEMPGKAFYKIYNGGDDSNVAKGVYVPIKFGDGSFDSFDSVRILQNSDIVCTNPPFSKQREFQRLLLKNNADFLFIGNILNSIVKSNFKDYLNCDIDFVPQRINSFMTSRGIKKIGTSVWVTSFNVEKPFFPLKRHISQVATRHLKGFYGIEVAKACDIPNDYFGEIAVPVTFAEKLNRNQFEVKGFIDHPFLHGTQQGIMKRLIIQRKV